MAQISAFTPQAAEAAALPFHPAAMLTPLEVAQRFCFRTPKPIRLAIARGELRASHIGGKLRILGANANDFWLRQQNAVPMTPERCASPAAGVTRPKTHVRRARRQPILGQGR